MSCYQQAKADQMLMYAIHSPTSSGSFFARTSGILCVGDVVGLAVDLKAVDISQFLPE